MYAGLYSRSNSIELILRGFRTLDGDTGEFNGITSTVTDSALLSVPSISFSVEEGCGSPI